MVCCGTEVIQIHEGATSASQTITQLRRIFARFGIPKQIVSDNGPQFVSSEFRTFCKKQGIRHTLVPPYHPQSNGQAERFVKTLKVAIKKDMESGKASLEEVVTDFCQSTEIPAIALQMFLQQGS